MDANLLNGLSLAYIGDAVYELKIREYFISLGYTKVKDLHKKTVVYTSGAAQAEAILFLLSGHVLTEMEINIFKRGRNSHVHTSRKNLDIQEYMNATGFESLIGYLHLTEQHQRLNDLINCILQRGEGGSL